MEEGQEEKEEQRGTGQRKERKGQGEKRKARLQQTNKETQTNKGGWSDRGDQSKWSIRGWQRFMPQLLALSGDLKRAVHCFLLSTAYFFASMVLHMFMAFVFACFILASAFHVRFAFFQLFLFALFAACLALSLLLFVDQANETKLRVRIQDERADLYFHSF